MTVRTTWLTSPGQTREDTRRAPVGTMTPVDEAQTVSGVIPGGDPYALSDTGAMAFDIGPGRAIIQGTSAQGAYGHVVTAAESFVVADGHASLARIDSVFAVIYDNLYDASGNTLGDIVLVEGTAAASPAAPSAPTTSSIRLHNIDVPAGASAGTGGLTWGTAVTDQRTYTVAVGGIHPGSIAGAYAGQWRDAGGATGILERYNGTTWEPKVRLGNSGVLEFGDVNLYRGATNQLKTDDDLVVGGNFGGAANFQTGAGTDYTPAWTAENGAAPTIGNGILVGRWYRQGRWISFWIKMVIGSTTNLAAQDSNANWRFGLPVPCSTALPEIRVIKAQFFDDDANDLYNGSGVIDGAINTVIRSVRVAGESTASSAGIWDKTSPVTWGTSDQLFLWGEYEAAS